MENFIKALFISLLTSGSFVTQAAEQYDKAPWEAISAARREMNLEEYRSLRPFLDGETRAQWKKEEEADRKVWENAQSEAWIREYAPEQFRTTAQTTIELPQQQPFPTQEKELQGENEYQKLLALRARQSAQRQAQQQAQKEDERRQMVVPVRQNPQPIEVASFISQVNALSGVYASSPKRPILVNFMRIFSELATFAAAIQDKDVHYVDGYVAENVGPLLEVGSLFKLDNPKLTLEEVGKQMKDFMAQLPEFFGNYKYAKGTVAEKPVTAARIQEVLDLHFKNLLVSENIRETWSRAWTLALKLYTEYRSTEYIEIIFDKAIEGHETQGGCVQGRIDRALIAYVTLLGKAGVGIH